MELRGFARTATLLHFSLPQVFTSKKTLIEHKKRIDEQLRLLRGQMKNLQEIKLYLKRSRPDKNDDTSTTVTQETHICRCEGGLDFTTTMDESSDGDGGEEFMYVGIGSDNIVQNDREALPMGDEEEEEEVVTEEGEVVEKRNR